MQKIGFSIEYAEWLKMVIWKLNGGKTKDWVNRYAKNYRKEWNKKLEAKNGN